MRKNSKKDPNTNIWSDSKALLRELDRIIHVAGLPTHARNSVLYVLEKMPEHFNTYARIGIELARTDKDACACHQFLMCGVKLLQQAPEHVQEYAEIGLKLMSYEERPTVFGPGMTFYFLAADEAIPRTPAQHRKAYLSAARILADHDPQEIPYFLKHVPESLEKLQLEPPLEPEQILIEHIHDPHSAQLVGQLIDRKKYRKEYGEKCRKFYG